MQAAFLRGLVFPPPAAGAEILADGDRARARRAADAGHELVVQRVVGHLVQGDVVPDVVPGPVGERIELGAAVAVGLDERDAAAVVGLLAAQAGDPGGAPVEHAPEGLHLANLAARLAQLDAAVHRLRPVPAHEVHHLLLARAIDLDLQAVAFLDARDQRRRLGVQLAGLERADRDAEPEAGDQVGDDHVLRAEAGRLHDAAAVIFGRGLQQLDRRVELGLEVGARMRVERDRRRLRRRGQRRERRGFGDGGVGHVRQPRGRNAAAVAARRPGSTSGRT